MEGLNYFQVKRGMGGREGEVERERERERCLLLSLPIQICFAYKGNFAGVSVRVSFLQVDPNTNIIISQGFRNINIR